MNIKPLGDYYFPFNAKNQTLPLVEPKKESSSTVGVEDKPENDKISKYYSNTILHFESGKYYVIPMYHLLNHSNPVYTSSKSEAEAFCAEKVNSKLASSADYNHLTTIKKLGNGSYWTSEGKIYTKGDSYQGDTQPLQTDSGNNFVCIM
ncbi:hypothetical protein [Vibrio campbellii]|uniref:hypothetical protein n=1 Tax=Vibrio campbellii TaxID=680 RepID=UPI000CD377AC|nr:hypothetical protein [Vibrio campbellii]AUW07422.1 hypothetical protein C1N51_27595 [Vibrio campbellii]